MSIDCRGESVCSTFGLAVASPYSYQCIRSVPMVISDACEAICLRLAIGALAQERMTSKQVRLRNLGCCNSLVTGVGSCFTPPET